MIQMRLDSPNNFGPSHSSTLTPVDSRPVSSGQVKYLNDLRAEFIRLRGILKAADIEIPTFHSLPAPQNCTEARRNIDAGKNIVRQLRVLVRNLPTPEPTKTVVDEGMWIIGEFGFHSAHEIYKVQVAVHGSGRLYAKLLDKDSGRFVHAPGAIRKLQVQGRKMTLKEAKEYGALYGTCVRCGRTLTDEDSIAAGIGPICAEKF